MKSIKVLRRSWFIVDTSNDPLIRALLKHWYIVHANCKIKTRSFGPGSEFKSSIEWCSAYEKNEAIDKLEQWGVHNFDLQFFPMLVVTFERDKSSGFSVIPALFARCHFHSLIHIEWISRTDTTQYVRYRTWSASMQVYGQRKRMQWVRTCRSESSKPDQQLEMCRLC